MSVRIIMKLLVEKREQLDDDLVRLWFRHPIRPQLPKWTPGAHVDVRLDDGKIRQYSLTSDPNDLARYAITVKREGDGRGGSAFIYDHFTEGSQVRVSMPRNNFKLVPGKGVLIAGGIGVTPLISMGRALSQIKMLESFHFCAKTPRPSIEEELSQFCEGSLSTYFSNDPDSHRLNLASLIENLSSDLHIYCCGPERLMSEVRYLTSDWNPDQLHFETFKITGDQDQKAEPFDVTVSSTGETLRVSESQSILDVLKVAGYVIPSSCRQGICGTCECRYTSGDVIHRDSILSPDERQDRIMPCVSRARVSVTLDL